MMKESAKGTPEYEQYKKEFIALCETYDRLEEEWYKENPNPNAHLKGKEEPTPRHIKIECNQKIKELQKKYHMLFE